MSEIENILSIEMKDSQAKSDRIDELEETCKTHMQQTEMYRNHLSEANENSKTLQRQSIESGNTIRRLQSDYDAYKKSSQQEFRCLKAELITSLRAINLCLLASINTEKQQLTHRARNFRMRHVNQIISNEIDRFCDRKLTSYEDDF